MLGSSECSSGCESGWTLYFDNSIPMNPPPPFPSSFDHETTKYRRNISHQATADEDEDEEEEDMSMVSDASSGPPHDDLHDNNHDQQHATTNYYFNNNGGAGKIDHQGHRSRSRRRSPTTTSGKSSSSNNKAPRHQPPSFLDDTASSPIFPNKHCSYRDMPAAPIMESFLHYPSSHGPPIYSSPTNFQGISSSAAFQHQFGVFQPDPPLPSETSTQVHHHYNNQWF